MIFRQITHDDLGCASYLIGDEDAGVAAVADPKLDIDEYLRLARYLGVRIEHILETHNHADHVSGHARLAAATGATIHIHHEARAEYEHEPFGDGWELELGAIQVRAVHTPGHRPEHTAFTLADTGRGPEPWAELTGDTLFVGDIARPDLALDRETGAQGIFRSLRDRVLTLSDECEVWPGHLGGSLCGCPGIHMKASSTIGYEQAHQHLLAIADEQEFVERATASLGPQPPNFESIVALNRGPLRCVSVEAHPLAPRQVDAHQRDGALVIDVRDARRAVELAAAVGITEVAGYLAGGMTSWREEKRPVARMVRLTLAELHDRWEPGGHRLQVLDVRERAEWEDGHIPGSIHAPYHDISALPTGIDPDQPVAVVCGSGQRAAVGASLLQRLGARHVVHVGEGGVPLWRRRGWPIDSPGTNVT